MALDPIPGPATLIWMAWEGPVPLPEIEPDVTEVILRYTPLGGYVAHAAGAQSMVEGRTQEDSRLLQWKLGMSDARIAIAVATEHVPSSHRGGRSQQYLAVNLYGFARPRGHDWHTPLLIGVDDKPLRTIYGLARMSRQPKPDRAIAWLKERLLIPPRPGSPSDAPKRMIVSAGVALDANRPAAFRVHGRGVAADVRIVGDRAMVTRVTRQGTRDQQGQLTLVESDVDFTDESRATRLQAEMKRQVSRLAAGEGFLAMWNDYNRFDSRYLTRRVVETGYVRYETVETLRGGLARFTVSPSSLASEPGRLLFQNAAKGEEQEEPLEVEAALRLPGILARMDGEAVETTQPDVTGDWGLLDESLDKATVRGRVVNSNPRAGTIDVRLATDDGTDSVISVRRRPSRPDPKGFLYMSYRGDRQQMLRRREAWQRILNRGTRIPNLLSLLEGEAVEAPPPPAPIDPRSEAAIACFHGGDPTPAQLDALNVALNTPDIAIIQGPPGTGKTQVITALQTRLAEEGRVYAHLRGSMLLTSYQHAAVDELVERSVIYGLPASKVDRAGRGTTVQADRWRQETMRHLLSQLDGTSQGRGVRALRETSIRVAGYLLAPVAGNDLVRLLREIAGFITGLVPGRLTDELRMRALELELPAMPWTLTARDEFDLAVRAVRGIRTTPESFGDDGPAMAGKALRWLRALLEKEEAEGPLRMALAEPMELLSEAARWPSQGPGLRLDDLARVQDELLDLLMRPTGPTPDPVVDPDVATLLQQVADTLEQQLRDSPEDGAELALQDFLEALEGDPVAVNWSLREYTASYAATCQQASSRSMADAKQSSRIDEVVFDTVIVDEAARANPLDLMIPLIHAGRRIVLVGDHHQLPHMLEPDVERMFQDRDGAPEQLRQSLFERLFRRLGDNSAVTRRVVTLDTQFRMHPTLGKFVSRNFYKNTLESKRPATEFAHNLPGYEGKVAAWIDLPPDTGQEYGDRSKYRPVEARRIAAEVQRLLDAAPQLTFGIITFYSAQANEIWKELRELGLATLTDRGYEVAERLRYDRSGKRLDRLHVGTVDAFQGKEFDVVFLSVTRCPPPGERPPSSDSRTYQRWVRRRYGHITLKNRMCVAMSRQKRMLIAVGAKQLFAPETAPDDVEPLVDFLRLCEEGERAARS
ncbi:AAA domain-containing protein [Nonomuraea angiospora]|uniref:DEAD/DEAH box helicase n=1 Tax=Nonomuraea angiospora TaxID=46172 RepID=UPI003410F9CE